MATSILSLSEQGREIYDLSGMAAAINMCLEMRDSGFNEQGEQAEAGIEALVPELARRMTALYESYHETRRYRRQAHRTQRRAPAAACHRGDIESHG